MSRRKNNGEAFVSRMNELRLRFKSTTEFADFLGISRQTLSFWLKGERTPDMDMLVKISKALNMSIDYLVGLTDKNTKDYVIRIERVVRL